MEIWEFIEELEKVEKTIGSSAGVFINIGGVEEEIYGIEIRPIDDFTYEVIVKGWL